MSTHLRSAAATVLALLFLAETTSAQVENDLVIDAVGTGSSIEVTISMNIGGALPPEWIGWVVDRATIGVCNDDFRLGPATPFPTGAQDYVLTDTNVITNVGPALTYKYRVYAVDDQGARHSLGSPPAFPPVYLHDAFATAVLEPGAVAGGTIVDLGGQLGVELCPDQCWEPISFISYYYPWLELENLAGTQQPVWLVGWLDNDFEGTYITLVEDIAWPRWGCGSPLDGAETSWGALKSRYR